MTLTGHAGTLHARRWTPDASPMYVVLLCHGYGEHIGRYEWVAERLVAEGRMTPAGLAVIDRAKADGSWALLDDVENLTEPPDLAAALDAVPAARAAWDGFPRSARRAILEWIVLARRPATRAARIAATVSEAEAGRRANQWPRPTA